MSKSTFPDFWITRIGYLRAEIQQIIEMWWPFWIMQIRCFPIQGFLRTFKMVFWGPHRNSLWQKNSVTICSKWNLTLPGLIHTYTHTHIHIDTQTNIHTHWHIHTYTYTHIHTYTHTHIHAYTHTHIHTYTHTHRHTRMYGLVLSQICWRHSAVRYIQP